MRINDWVVLQWIDGRGNPNTSQEYKDAIEALYALAYGLKFMVKKEEVGVDYVVMPLEGLWWTEDMTQFSIEGSIMKSTSVILVSPNLRK